MLMDIDLLSKMVADLILERDEVALPGVGVFVAEIVPASFSDRGYTINPPYRRLSFRQREGRDRSLIDLYARTNGIGVPDAERLLLGFLDELKSVLTSRKTIIFPGLGRLRATRENHFFFVPDESLNIYPEGFGLQPLSLKFRNPEEDAAHTAAVVAELATTVGARNAGGRDGAQPLNGNAAAQNAGSAGAEKKGQGADDALTGSSDAAMQKGAETPGTFVSERESAVAEADDTWASVRDGAAVETDSALASARERAVAEADSTSIPVRENAVTESPVRENVVAKEAEQGSAEAVSDGNVGEARQESAHEEQVPVSGDADAEVRRARKHPVLRFLCGVIVTAVLLLAALAVTGRVAPRLVDTILYTAEERALIWN